MSKQMIATETLFIGRTRAHNVGDVVPAENVEKYGWGDKVSGQGTKAATAAQEAASTPTSASATASPTAS